MERLDRQELKRRLGRAMRELRDAEDWARLELADDLLADRIRGIHESLTDDVLNGNANRLPDRWRANLWDRYCLLRRHDPNAGARVRSYFLHRARTRV